MLTTDYTYFLKYSVITQIIMRIKHIMIHYIFRVDKKKKYVIFDHY